MVVGVNARLLIPDRIEGLARFTWETTKSMILAHPDDQFILFFDRKPDQQFIDFPNVTGVTIHPQARHPILYKIWFEWMLPRYVKKHKVDVFYSADNFMSLGLSIPTLLVLHDLAFDRYPEYIGKTARTFYHKYIPKYIARANHLCTVSEYIKDEIVANYDVDPQNIDVTYNALPQRVSKPSKRMIEGKYFVCVSSIHPRKNQARLIQAFDKYRSEHKESVEKLVLIGRRSGVYSAFDKALESSQWRTDIILLHDISDDVIESYMRHAEALVYPSIYEGFGIPILEGFAANVPVITSDSSSMSEVAGGAAILITPTSVDSMASGLASVMDKEYANRLVKLGVERLQDFDWDASARVAYRCLTNIFKG